MLKSLKPSMREKKRYLLLKGKFTKKDVEKAILDYIGVLGYSKAGIIWINNNIIAINRKEVDKVRASFVFTNNISVERVSGSIKKVK